MFEATRTYYTAVAYHLVAAGAQVAVLNQLVVKRFIPMPLSKSDRKDAQWLPRYSQQQPTPRWQPNEALVSPSAAKHLQQARRRLERQAQQLKAELRANVEQHYATEMPLLCSITCIGRKTATLLLPFAGRLHTLGQLPPDHRQSRTLPARAFLW